MTEIPLSRRRTLQSCLVGSFAGVAGCLGGGDSEESTPAGNGTDGNTADGSTGDGSTVDQFSLAGNGAEDIRNWLAPEAKHPSSGETEVLFAVQDFETAIDQGWEELANVRRSKANTFGVEPSSIHKELIIGLPEGNRVGSIYLGDFDIERILSELESNGETPSTEYEGYSVFAGQFALGSDAILVTPEYEQFIDAKRGSGPLMESEYDGLSTVLDVLPEAGQVSVSKRNDLDDISLTGSAFVSFESGGSFTRVIRTFIFTSPDTTSVERAEEIVSQGRYQETLNSEQQGKVVMLEYSA
jgi:hypothetical protein